MIPGGSVASSTRTGTSSRDRARARRAVRHGVDLNKLQGWAANQYQEQLNNEESRQNIAIQKMKKQVISNAMIVRLQSWFRMLKHNFVYKKWKRQRIDRMYLFFRAWYTAIRADILFRRTISKRPFREWAVEANESKRLSNLSLMIFKRAVNKSKLTPQAVMAYFNPSGYDGKITEQELNSIRRLMLKCLFTAWVSETKLLRIHRFKAGQIITRTMRRTFGNLSVKETLMLTLHLWHRLAAVNAAESRGDPQPNFSYPYIADWPKILQNITMKRIRKIRAADRANILIQKRAFRGWTKAIENDNAPDDSDNQCRAEAHYVEKLSIKVLAAWWALSRERGKNLRRREKCYRAWAAWAPRNRRLKAAKRITIAWTHQSKTHNFFRQWSTAMHGIVASRTYSLRALRENLFQPKVLYLAYTFLGRDSHLMFLDCWQRWKGYWEMRHRWRTAKWKFRATWCKARQQELFNSWRRYVIIVRRERDPELQSMKKMGIIAIDENEFAIRDHRRNALTRTLSKIFTTEKGEFDGPILGKTGWYQGSVLRTLFDVMDEGRCGKLERLPNREEYMLCLRALLHHNKTQAQALSASAQPVQSDEDGALPFDCEDGIYKAMIAMDVNKAMEPILDGIVVTPEHIEKLSIAMGDRFVPLVALLLSRCASYVAKRILQGDIKEHVLMCNNPLMCLLLGTHVTRWDEIKLSRRDLVSVTEDQGLENFSGSKYQTNIMLRAVTLLLMHKRLTDLRKSCENVPANLTESEEVALIIRRQKVARMWRVEVCMRRMFDLGDDVAGIEEMAEVMAVYNQFYVGKQTKVEVVKEKKKAMDPWIMNLDLGSLLREYALLTGSMADAARQIREPIMKRDDGLLQRGLEQQARKDYLALKELALSELPKNKVDRGNNDVSLDSTKKSAAAPPDAPPVVPQLTSALIESLGSLNGIELPPSLGDSLDGSGSVQDMMPTSRQVSSPTDMMLNTARTDFSSREIQMQRSFSNVTDDGIADAPASFQGNNNAYEPPLDTLLETWWPKLPKGPPKNPQTLFKYSLNAKIQQDQDDAFKTTRKNITSRFVGMANATVARLISLLEQTGLPTLAEPHSSNFCKLPANVSVAPGNYTFKPTKAYVHLGPNLVEFIHSKPSRIMQINHLKWWPKKWWQPNRLAEAIQAEILKMEQISKKTKNDLKATQKEYKALHNEVQTYTTSLGDSRKRMVSIGKRTRQYIEEAGHTKTAKNRLISGAEKNITIQKESINKLQTLITVVRIKIDNGQFEEALDALEVRYSREDAAPEKLQSLAKISLLAKEGELPGMLESLSALELELKRHEVDLRVYERQSIGVKNMLNRLANDKFANTVDVQELLLSKSKKLFKLKTTENTERKLLKSLNKYCDDLMEYVLHLSGGKPNEGDGMGAVASGSSLSERDRPDSSGGKIDRKLSKSGSRKSMTIKKSKSFTKAGKPSPRDSASSSGGRTSVLNRAASGEGQTIGVRQTFSFEELGDNGDSPEKSTMDSPETKKSSPPKVLREGSIGSGEGLHTVHEGDDHSVESLEKSIVKPSLIATENDELGFESGDEDVFGADTPRSPTSPDEKFVDFHGLSKGRLSLIDFTKKVSQDDLKSLNRRTIENELSDDEQSVASGDPEIVVTEEQLEKLRTEIQKEYWDILAQMEKQPGDEEDTAVTMEGEDEMGDTMSQKSGVEGHSASYLSHESRAFEDDDDESVILRRMNRTARLYAGVKKSFYMQDGDSVQWDDGLVEEGEEEMTESQQLKQRVLRNSELDDPAYLGQDLDSSKVWEPINMFTLNASVGMSAAEHPDKQSTRKIKSGTATPDHESSPINTTRRRAVAKITVMDPYASIGSRNFEHLKHNAREESLTSNADDDKDEEYFALLEERELRRRLSKIDAPEDEQEVQAQDVKDEEEDAKSDDTNGDERFWPDGSPLGIGPQGDDDSITSGIFDSFSLNDSVEEEDGIELEEEDDDDMVLYDEEGNRRKPYLWEQIKKKPAKSIYSTPLPDEMVVASVVTDGVASTSSPAAVEAADNAVSPISRQNSAGDSSVPSVRRASYASGTGTSVKGSERERRSTGRSSKRNSTESVASSVEILKMRSGSVTGKLSSGVASPTRDGSPSESISRSSSWQLIAGSKSQGPSMDISDELDEEEDNAAAQFGDVDAQVFSNSLPLNLHSALQGGSVESVESQSLSSRSSVTACSDADRGSDYQPISAVAVSIARNVGVSAAVADQAIVKVEQELGPDGGKAVLVGGKWELQPHRRIMIAPKASSEMTPTKKAMTVLPEEPLGVSGESVDSTLSGFPPSLIKPSTADAKTTPHSSSRSASQSTKKKRNRQPIEVRGVSPDRNLRTYVEREDIEKPAVVHDPTKWTNQLFSGAKGEDLKAKSEFSDESSSPNASPAARLIMDGYSTQPTHENGTATKPKPVPILRRGLRLGPDIQNQDNTLADYVESQLRDTRRERDLEVLTAQLQTDGDQEEGFISPSQMTDTSSRGNSPRPHGQSEAHKDHRKKKGVGFFGLDDDLFEVKNYGPSLPTILSASSMEELGEDSSDVMSSVKKDIPDLCIDNIRQVYSQDTARNKYHIENISNGKLTSKPKYLRADIQRTVQKANKDREKLRSSMSSVEPVDMTSESGTYYAPTSHIHGQSILQGSIDFPASPMTMSTQSSSYSGMPIKEKFARLQSKNIFEITDDDKRSHDVDLKVQANSILLQNTASHSAIYKINTAPSSFSDSQQGFPTTRSSKHTARTNPITARSTRASTPVVFGLTDRDYSSLALPPLSVNAKATGADFQVQVLAKRLLERPSEVKKRLPESPSGHVMPVYFRDTDITSARSLGDVSTASSEDGVLLRAYAAALGIDEEDDDAALPGGVHEQLSDLLSSIQSARHHIALSPTRSVTAPKGAENDFALASGNVIATQKGMSSTGSDAVVGLSAGVDIHTVDSAMAHHEYSVEQDGGDSIGSTDVGDHLDDLDTFMVTRKHDGFDLDCDDDDDIDNEMRELLRQSRVDKRSNTPCSNHVRALSASHSANAILHEARRLDSCRVTGGPQRAKICTSPLRSSRKTTLKPAVLSGGEKLPSLRTVGLSNKKDATNRRSAMSASASDSVLKRNALMSGLQKITKGEPGGRQTIVDMSKSLSMLSTTS